MDVRETATGVGVALVAAAIYAGSCWFFPYAKCPRCTGSGKRARKDGKVFRLCGRCDGSGRRLRIGRRLWNAYRRRRAATR